MVWIRTIAPEDATGELAEAYDWQAKRLGRPAEFALLGSLEPPLVHARLVLYKATENNRSALTVEQRTVLAHVTSALNHTPHCLSRTRIKLRHLGWTEEAIAAIEGGDYSALSAPDQALVAYATTLTLDPGGVTERLVEDLRAAGFGDHEIVAANAQVAHLNYANRVANGLGLLREELDDFPSFDTVPQ